MTYPPFAVTVDIALFTIEDATFKILLIERGGNPYRGDLALPGGFVLPDENLDAAASRELEEETGLGEGSWHLEQLAAYGDPARDPRMRTVTVAFWAITADLPRPRGGGDAAAAHLVPVDGIESGDLRLAFDHDRIVGDAVKRIRSRLETTTVAAQFCPPAFTVAELRRVYETIWNTPLDPGNFQRFVRDSGVFERVPSGGPDALAASSSVVLESAPSLDYLESGQKVMRRAIDDAESAPSSDAEPSMDVLVPRQQRRGRPASRWMVPEGRPRLLARPLRRKTDDP
ncbi:MAG: NUDIX domain-containing protein [Gammaproteobacteria bacterium]|nr:NUDIX domain-containing protein [Gammaproteobacteria bacterium]MDE0241931.1 NUDIX domain-containing protein [bacterium]